MFNKEIEKEALEALAKDPDEMSMDELDNVHAGMFRRQNVQFFFFWFDFGSSLKSGFIKYFQLSKTYQCF